MRILIPFLLFVITACQQVDKLQQFLPKQDFVLREEKPLVIAHRGASGYLPEHTLPAYSLAMEMGADFIEPDLVLTRDGVLIARHENELSTTTDIAQRFPDRKVVKTVDGVLTTGWFAEDFSLAELRQLRTFQAFPGRSPQYNGQYPIPTFAEILQAVRSYEQKTGRKVGVYPELKHPTVLGEYKMIDALLKELAAQGFDKEPQRVMIQSFEVHPLETLYFKKVPYRLIQLIGNPQERPFDQTRENVIANYGQMLQPKGLRDIAYYAKGVGLNKLALQPVDALGNLQPQPPLISQLKQAGLLVHVYTFRNEPETLAREDGGNPESEYCRFIAMGVDGVFTDFPDVALRVRQNPLICNR